MSLPRMSLHIGDYKKDTGHLRAAGHGGYLLLMMHYWSTGTLPEDEKQLASIALMTKREWMEWGPILKALFKGNWKKHKRIDKELAAAKEKYERRARAGAQGGAAKAAKLVQQCSSNATAKAKQPITNNQGRDDDGGDAREAPARGKSLVSDDAVRLTTEIAAICGFPTPPDWPLGWFGAPMRVQVFLDQGWQGEIMLAATREVMAKKRGGAPSSIRYFEKPFASAHAMQAAPLPEVRFENPEVVHAQRFDNRGTKSTPAWRDPILTGMADLATKLGLDGEPEEPGGWIPDPGSSAAG